MFLVFILVLGLVDDRNDRSVYNEVLFVVHGILRNGFGLLG